MINLLNSSKLFLIVFLFFITICNVVHASDPVDIWEKKEKTNTEDKIIKKKNEFKSLIFNEDSKEGGILISEEEVESKNTIVGLFDPAENNLSLNMWIPSDGEEIKNTLKRINKIQLSKFSENLLFKILFTNAYAPQKNLSADEFLDIKIDWLIKNNRIEDLENLLRLNSTVGEKSKVIKILIEEYLASANIKSACDTTNLINKSVEDNFLEKFKIYCLIYEDRGNEAQLMLDLLKERNFKDKFFENKINFLLGFAKKTDQKIVDDDLFNFYLSQITIKDFDYQPNEKTNKYIWRYLSAANLIKIEDFDDEQTITTFEKAASTGTFEKKEIFNIYKKIIFNINQLLAAQEVYKTLPNYKARALIYQSILLSDNTEKKLALTFLLKELFDIDKMFSVYSEELFNILRGLDKENIPESYVQLVEKYSQEKFQSIKTVKFENDIIHKSKILKYFIEDDYSVKKTEKDIKSVYKKVKKNKKYFISIKDIIVLESLQNDRINLPEGLDVEQLSSKLTIPTGLEDIAKENQTGLALLKIVEIVGEDNIEDLDPETLYFLNKILNQLKLKKIRNNILSATLPTRV